MSFAITQSDRQPVDHGAYQPARPRFEFNFSDLAVGEFFQFPAECPAQAASRAVRRANEAAQTGKKFIVRRIGEARLCFRAA